MPDKLTQEGRLLQVFTTQPENTLVIRSLTGREAVSECFSFDVEFASENAGLEPSDFAGQKMTLAILCADDSHRYVNGIVHDFSLLDKGDHYVRYRARLVPWLDFLKLTSDCRIWQEKTAVEIIKSVFQDHGFTDFKDKLNDTYRTREYCVQYRESAYDFVCRLMEEEGICFYFEHTDDQHFLVLADNPTSHPECLGYSKYHWEPSAGQGFSREEDYVTEWTRTCEIRTQKWTQSDFNFETPHTDLLASQDTTISQKIPKLERYDYPGRFTKKDDSEGLTRYRIEAEEAGVDSVYGGGSGRTMAAGYTFTFAEHFRRDQAGDYLLTAIEHDASQGSLIAGDGGGEERYLNRFVCIPEAVKFRPARITQKPVISGLQTAFVTGPSGEEIYVDKYGRLKVQFHWDRLGHNDEKSSCWIRVAQSIAGKQWGSVYLPRVGQEVVVEFLEGDPDRPLVTGSVYNADAMPPYTLPDEKTKNTFKSYSSKGGGGFNELRFEDKKGNEQIFMQAEKDFHLRIKNDHRTIALNETHAITSKDQLEKIGGDHHLAVTGDQNQKVDGSLSLKVGMNAHQKVGQTLAVDAGVEIHLKAGTNLVIESGSTLTLKVGGNFININPVGVFIKGTMVMINSGGSAGSGASCSPAAPKEPKEADQAQAGAAAATLVAKQPPAAVSYSPAALMMKQAAQSGAPFVDVDGD